MSAHPHRLFLLSALALTLVASGASAEVFEQSDWSFHPLDPDWTRASHPADRTNWRRYFQASTEAETGGEVTLRRMVLPWEVDTAVDFQAGTLSGLIVADPAVAPALVLEGSADFGDGSDGAIVIDGLDPAANPDGQAHPWRLPIPTGVAAVAAGTSGGGLLAGSHTWAVTALNAVGETTTRTASFTTFAGQNVRLVWQPQTCATGYRVYRDGGLVTEIAATLPTEFIDDGSLAAGAPPPSSNTTENAYVVSGPLQVTSLSVLNCALVRSAPLSPLQAPTNFTATEVVTAGAVPSNGYFYSVRAVDQSGVEGRTGPEASLWVNAGSAVDLAWDAVDQASVYRVYRRPTSAGAYGSSSLVWEGPRTSYRDTAPTTGPGMPCSTCNATRGGRVVVRSLGTIVVDGRSIIDATGSGYAGGVGDAEVLSYEWLGRQGSSHRGDPIFDVSPRYGGGGGGDYGEGSFWGALGSGGGGHGAAGVGANGSNGGVPYGDAALTYPTLGSGGGAGVFGPRGGAGGGAVDLAGYQILIDGEVRANGGAGEASPSVVPAGGGAGGSIRLRGAEVQIAGKVQAAGGAASGMDVCVESCSVDIYWVPAAPGGGGRIAIYTPLGAAQVTGTVDVGSGARQGSFYQGSLGSSFNTLGTFESAVHDAGSPIVQAGQLVFTATRPANTALRLQVASSTDGLSFGPYLGPDCTSGTSYETSGEVLCDDVVGDRYLRLRAELESLDGLATPVLDRVVIDTVQVADTALLVSSAYDTGDPTGKVAAVAWSGQTAGASTLELQIRTAADAGGVPGAFGPWLGPTGTDETGSWYTDGSGGQLTNTLHRDGQDDRWIQYRARLSRVGVELPVLQLVQITYDGTSRGDVDLVIEGDGAGISAAYGSGAGGLGGKTSDPAVPASFALEVANAGEIIETYSVTWSTPLGFTITLEGQSSPASVTVAGLQSSTLALVAISAPDDVGTVDIIVNARAQSDAAKVDSVTARLTITGREPPGEVMPLSPLPDTVAVALAPNLCWAPPAGSTPLTYEVQIALDAAFTQGVQSAGSPGVDFNGTCLQPTLQPGTTYYWRVRADNAFFGPGPWPNLPWQFETGHGPAAPVALYPWDGMTATPLMTTLRWAAGAGGAGAEPSCYTVGLGEDDLAAQGSALPSLQCDTVASVGPLEPDALYRWCVRGENAFGIGPWSCFGFQADSLEVPEAPTWVAPLEGESDLPLEPRLSWEAGAGVAPDCFEVGVGEEEALAQQAAVRECSTELGWSPPLPADTVHHACVRALVEFWPGDWSCISFTTGTVPAAPALAYPGDAATEVTTPVARLGWTGPEGTRALEYVVRLWETPQPNATLREMRTLLRFAELPVEQGMTYGWEVAAINEIGEGPASPAWTFTTQAPSGTLQAVARIDPSEGTEGITQFTFDGSASSARPGVPIARTTWETGDGRPPVTALSFDYVYPAAGGYQVRLEVEDADGSTSEVRTPVRVLTADGRMPPTVRADASVTLGPAPLTVHLSAISGAGSGQVAALAWTLGDGNTTSGSAVDHTYTSAGTYVARVTAIDEQGLSASDFVVIAVSDPSGQPWPPSVRAYVWPPVVRVGEAFWPECVSFDPGDPSATLTTTWEIEGLSAQGAAPGPLVAPTAGLLELRCDVTSAGSGLTASDAVTLEVRTEDGLLPPRIVTSPEPTEVCAGEAFLYNRQMRAAARGSAPLLWRAGKIVGETFAGAPEGFGIDPTTGIIEWRPGLELVGPQEIAIRVENGAGIDTQEFSVEVSDCAPPVTTKREGCGCRSSGDGSTDAAALTLLLLGLAGFARRRRAGP